MDHDARIQRAIDALNAQSRPNIAAVARRFNVARTTLSDRFKGKTGSNEDANSDSRQRLTKNQEESLIEYINKLSDRGFPPTPQILKNIAESIAKSKLGKNWVSRFCSRNRERVKSIYLRNINHSRKIADNSEYFQHFYNTLREKLEKYRIDVQNIYNVDEKGFLLGLSRTTKRVVSLEGLKNKRLKGASQDGSREFITLIAAICTDGTFLPPALIYQGTSHDLQDTWLDEFDSKDQAYFASSENGWSDDTIGLNWLERVFNWATKEKVGPRDRRLLLVDGHSSHVNLPFIEYADENRILLAVLPPHSTHRLQPLDLGLFAPLATYYSQAIDQLLRESHGLVSLTKRDFWPMFHEAWKKAFCARNIRSAWEAAGLYPLNPQRAITNTITKPATPERQVMPPQSTKTPRSIRSYRRSVRKLNEEGRVAPDVARILRAGEKFAVDLDIARHEVVGLRSAVVHEKKRRKRGKAMNLYEEGEAPGQARFFSPERIARVRSRHAAAETAEEQRRQQVNDRKLQQVAARAEKAREAEERRKARQLAQQAARERRALEQAEKQAVREARRAEKAAATARQQEELEQRRIQRIQVKQAKERAIQSRKRSSLEEEGPRPPKRLRRNPSPTTNPNDLDTITLAVGRPPVKVPSRKRQSKYPTASSVERAIEEREQISGTGRFGRAIRRPRRLRE